MPSASIISGSSNPNLAKELGALTSLPLIETQLSKFPNLELRIRLMSSSHTGYVLQSFSHPVNSNIIEFLLLADAAHRMDYQKLVGIVPWLGYSKQDKVFLPGEPLSSQVIAQIIDKIGFSELITLDLHNTNILNYYSIPITNISTANFFAQHIKSNLAPDSVVVSPDKGSVDRSKSFAEKLGLDVVFLGKKRDLETGKVTVSSIKGNVSGKNVYLYDDIIATGSTLVETSRYLKNHGAQEITVIATHHLYIPGVDQKLFKSPIDKIIVSNTITPPKILKSNTQVVSIAPLISPLIDVS